MTTEYTYDIKAFQWDAKYRVFSQDAWNLEWIDEHYNVTAFPNMKESFYIKNYETGEQRLFTFSGEQSGSWVFVNEEDNIMCVIGIMPF